jgi:hypothetical protein
MTPTEAEWVAANVLPKRVIAGAGGIDMLRGCACQLGVCGACRDGRCDRCSHVLHPEWSRRPQSEAYMVNRRGGVVAEVWTGQGCRWRCACTGRAQVDPWMSPEAHADAVQPSLFAEATR